MRDSHTPAAMRAALQFLVASDIPADHKAVLIETLTAALRGQEDAHIRQQAAQKVSSRWHANEIAQLQTFLQGKTANSWQQADELTTYVATHMHRSAHDIRAKASELGLGVAIDYRMAKARSRSEDE